MANQTEQLGLLLGAEGLEVVLVQVNAPYRPAWIGRLPAVRALARLLPYLVFLWRAAGRCDIFHVMANSGWSWHLFAAPAIWLARIRGVPVLINYRGGGAEEFLRHAGTWVLPTMRLARCILVPSRYLQEVFKRFELDAQVVPNAVDLGRFAGTTVRRDGAPHIIVTRALEPIYDIATAIRAFAVVRQQHPTARLTVAGTGPEHGRLVQLTAELGVTEAVLFAGRIDNQRIADLYASAHLMFNTSLVDNTPNSVLEALASGVPVVSSRVGGVPHLVEDGVTAVLVPPGDPAAFAAAALDLLASPQKVQRLVSAGSEMVQQFAWPRVKQQLLAAYGAAAPR
jgi:glycosyltransferase involved in cell wall biosynthesis